MRTEAETIIGRALREAISELEVARGISNEPGRADSYRKLHNNKYRVDYNKQIDNIYWFKRWMKRWVEVIGGKSWLGR